MRITSSEIQLDSSRAYIFQRESQQNLRFSQGNRNLQVSTSEREVIAEGSRQRLRARREEVSDVPRGETVIPVVSIGEELLSAGGIGVDDDSDSLAVSSEGTKLAMTKKLLEILLQREIKLTRVEIADRGEAEEQARRLTEGGGAAPARGGFGLAYDRTTTIYEAEETEFASQGVVKTADGREIDFTVGLRMAREFSATESVSLRMGNLTDPLVINFDGNAADLTDEKFAFDLDADGTEEQVSFLKSGSGFLAFDRNGDGVINDGSELFGPETGDGFAELATYDDDGNDFIDEGDSVYTRLSVFNRNGAGEDVVTSLADAGVGAIYLDRAETEFSVTDDTNETLGQVRSSSVYIDEDGSVGTVQQVDLAV